MLELAVTAPNDYQMPALGLEKSNHFPYLHVGTMLTESNTSAPTLAYRTSMTRFR